MYTVTRTNAAGNATTRVDIEVKATALAPDSLSCLDDSVAYALTGVISGTPTAAQAQTTFIVTASNSAGRVTAAIAMMVAAATVGEWLPAD